MNQVNHLNSVSVEGTLVRDPVFRTTPKGTPLCKFLLASKRFLEEEGTHEVSFFLIETRHKKVEDCNNNGREGRHVRVVGRLKQDRWMDADGMKLSKVFIEAEHVEFRPEFDKYLANKQEDANAGDDD